MAEPEEKTARPGLFARLFGRGRIVEEPVSEPAGVPTAPDQAPSDSPVASELAETKAPDAPEAIAAIDHVAPEPVRLEPIAPVPTAPVPAAHVFKVAPPEPHPLPEAEPKPSWWQRLKSGLSRSSGALGQSITDVFTKRKLDAAAIEDLEDTLIRADLGLPAAMRIVEQLSKGRFDREVDAAEIKSVLASEVEKSLVRVAKPLTLALDAKPFVILVVGVNGSGKTTTIAKLTAKYRDEGRSVMLAAGDTFRAAAVEQLKVWGDRLGVEVVSRATGADAAGLAFDAVNAARAAGTDVLLMDTAGRLQNRTELMAELEKIIRVMRKVEAAAPHAVLLVLDATVGQNALSQVEIFQRVAGVTGLVMTKLDGTARGGILVAIADRFALPIHFIGVGEGADDLEPFAARDFARAIAGLEEHEAA